MSKSKTYRRLINSARWQRLRHAKLSSEPLCERCLEEGRLKAAREVHHITPVETGLTPKEQERLMFDAKNLRALCHDCHTLTHTEMGRSGKAANRRRAKELLQHFRDRFL